ncbi:hypothetical protein ACH50O_13615 [Methylomonas sp. 2BW1-5-20]|uniref:hypothetical protein n=1 Tax=Methylomonas sp. 2BW1-5-20 TaxID=3376686 RepID=UPI00404FD7DF
MLKIASRQTKNMSMFTQLFHLLPDVVWSGIIASLLTLCGVLISNRSNTTRLRIQLKHDASEKAKERTASMRKEVYLEAVEELTKANSHLASLPQADLTKINAADGLQGFFAAASKLQLVAEPKTALLVNQLVGTYGELLLRLMERLVPLQKAKLAIAINDDLYNKAQFEVQRVLSEMARFNESAQSNEQVFGALERAFASYQAQTQNYAEARQDAWADFNNLNIQFCRQLFIDMRIVGQQQISVIIEIRRDLGLTAYLAEMREQMESQWERMSIQLDRMISALQGS